MLNITSNTVQGEVKLEDFTCQSRVNLTDSHAMLTRWLLGALLVVVVILFLPWTQNIQADGNVTTLRPEHRPQTIHSTIAGRIEEWYVREGEVVKKGDTIAYLSEIKAEYFDPDIVSRTQEQVAAKRGSADSYANKAVALEQQVVNMRRELKLKKEQLQNKIIQSQNKITSDSIQVERAKIDYDIAKQQLKRSETMYGKGYIPLIELESKRLKVQETNAKQVAAEQKFIISKNELLNARIAFNNIDNEYQQKIQKAESDRFGTISQQLTANADANKLQIQASNYEQRSQFYYITSPQDAYITLALTPGIGETIKEGDAIVSIMPVDFELAVEIFVRPMDLPLIELGNEVRFIFDGWPAIVFSGWPTASYGTFSGKVVAIDNNISSNGRYRILVSPEDTEKPWPSALRPGSGAQGIALLGRVPLWYEVWRELNGFPPDLTGANKETDKSLDKLKAPLKSVK